MSENVKSQYANSSQNEEMTSIKAETDEKTADDTVNDTVYQQTLSVSGQLCKDNKKISNYRIQENSIFYLRLNLRGS